MPKKITKHDVLVLKKENLKINLKMKKLENENKSILNNIDKYEKKVDPVLDKIERLFADSLQKIKKLEDQVKEKDKQLDKWVDEFDELEETTSKYRNMTTYAMKLITEKDHDLIVCKNKLKRCK